MNDFLLSIVRSKLASLPAWQEFEKRRRAKTIAALRAMAADGCDHDLDTEAAAAVHLESILSAALPLEDLAELLGTDGLQALGAALQKKGS
jgi:hypothetical protein